MHDQAEQFENASLRTRALLGDQAFLRLQNARVAIFGIGGVGGYVADALARCGVGHLTLVDGDTFSETNLNRQTFADRTTLGQAKVEAAKTRISLIAPQTEVQTRADFYTEENAHTFDLSQYDYVVDAVDSVGAKVALALACRADAVPLIICMGAGNKLDPCAFCCADLSKTHTDRLAKALRIALRRHNITHAKCIFSKELPHPPLAPIEDGGKPSVGSLSFVVGAAGMALAGEVVRDLVGITSPCVPHGKKEGNP
jgi:tRNA A37 threonylcarbamoyladenosine dehydratase